MYAFSNCRQQAVPDEHPGLSLETDGGGWKASISYVIVDRTCIVTEQQRIPLHNSTALHNSHSVASSRSPCPFWYEAH